MTIAGTLQPQGTAHRAPLHVGRSPHFTAEEEAASLMPHDGPLPLRPPPMARGVPPAPFGLHATIRHPCRPGVAEPGGSPRSSLPHERRPGLQLHFQPATGWHGGPSLLPSLLELHLEGEQGPSGVLGDTHRYPAPQTGLAFPSLLPFWGPLCPQDSRAQIQPHLPASPPSRKALNLSAHEGSSQPHRTALCPAEGSQLPSHPHMPGSGVSHIVFPACLGRTLSDGGPVPLH